MFTCSLAQEWQDSSEPMSALLENISRVLGFVIFATVASAAPFEAPTDASPPFRRDLLPIDTDSMARLSEDLDLLVRGNPPETATSRRAAAQALALAHSLDPSNADIRVSIEALEGAEALSPADPKRLTEGKARLWQIHAWLVMPEAGKDGNVLGNLLGDVTSVLDDGNPVGASLRKNPEKGDWDGWVAPLAAFEVKKPVKNTTDPFKDIEPETPEPEVAESASPAIILESASVGSVLYFYEKSNGSWVLRPASVEMTASSDGSGGFEIAFPEIGPISDQMAATLVGPIGAAVEAGRKEPLGEGTVSITAVGKSKEQFAKNGAILSGPGFILANAAVTGIEPNATVIAQLNEANQLVAPDFCWRMICALEGGEGGRIVVPSGTEPYFTAMLTMEKPEFLLNYEVLVASSPAEFMEMCAREPSEKNAAAFASFQEIKAKAIGTATGTYLANRFVRQRLEEIVDAVPNHLSAKLLAMQGAGERPRWLPKKVLAAEVWRAVDPISALATQDFRLPSEKKSALVEDVYEKARAELDFVERYVDTSDKEILDAGISATATVRSLERVLGSRTDDLIERFESIAVAQEAMVKANTVLLQKLSALSGDPLPKAAGE